MDKKAITKSDLIQTQDSKKYFSSIKEVTFTTSSYAEAQKVAKQIMDAFQNESIDHFERNQKTSFNKARSNTKTNPKPSPKKSFQSQKKEKVVIAEDLYEQKGDVPAASQDGLQAQAPVSAPAPAPAKEPIPTAPINIQKKSWWQRFVQTLSSFFTKKEQNSAKQVQDAVKDKKNSEKGRDGAKRTTQEWEVSSELKVFLDVEHLCFPTCCSPYVPLLDRIAQTWSNLPIEMRSATESIIKKTLSILHCMEQDERDVQAGMRF